MCGLRHVAGVSNAIAAVMAKLAEKELATGVVKNDMSVVTIKYF